MNNKEILNSTNQINNDLLFESLLASIKKIARLQKKKSYNLTLQTTEIVHETYIRFLKEKSKNWETENSFLAAFAVTMRRFLVDQYRAKKSDKRGGKYALLDIDGLNVQLEAPDGFHSWIVLDDLLNELNRIDSVARKVVELRYFVGLTLDEAANVLELSPRTITRKWQFARAYLHRELEQTKND